MPRRRIKTRPQFDEACRAAWARERIRFSATMRLVPAAWLLCFTVLAFLLAGCNRYDPFHSDTANLVGVWSLDNSLTRRADEEPVTKTLTVYATHMEFCPGQGTFGVQGEWRGDGWLRRNRGRENHRARASRIASRGFQRRRCGHARSL